MSKTLAKVLAFGAIALFVTSGFALGSVAPAYLNHDFLHVSAFVMALAGIVWGISAGLGSKAFVGAFSIIWTFGASMSAATFVTANGGAIDAFAATSFMAIAICMANETINNFYARKGK